MASSLLGIDIGTSSLKLALVKNGEVLRTSLVPTPADSLEHGMFVNAEPLSAVLRTAMKHEGIHAHNVAVTLPYDAVAIRHSVLTCATDNEAVQALPHQFDDITQGEPQQYLFDYLTQERPIPNFPTEVLVACVRRSFIESLRSSIDAVGLHLVKVSPAICSYISLIRALQDGVGASYFEYCIADFGNQAIRLHMFRNDRHVAEYILNKRSFSVSNSVIDYDELAISLANILKSYREDNPRSPMTHIWPIGGRASTPELRTILSNRLHLCVHHASELFPGQNLSEAELYAQSAGIAIYRPGREPS